MYDFFCEQPMLTDSETSTESFGNKKTTPQIIITDKIKGTICSLMKVNESTSAFNYIISN